MKHVAIVLVCLPFMIGCMATQWLHDHPGVRDKRVAEFRQAFRVDDVIMVEYDATLRNISMRKDITDVRHTASIILSRRQDDGRYPIEILESALPPSASAGTSIPIIPDHKNRTQEFRKSGSSAAVYPQRGNFYLMLQSTATPEVPEALWYYECGGRYNTWWRPIVIFPAYPVAIVFDVVTSPIQFMIIMNALSKIDG